MQLDRHVGGHRTPLVADGNRNEELDGLLDLHAVDILEDELRAILSDAVHTETAESREELSKTPEILRRGMGAKPAAGHR